MWGIDTVKRRVSQTFLNFFDVYSQVDQKAYVDSRKNQNESPMDLRESAANEGTFVMNFEDVP